MNKSSIRMSFFMLGMVIFSGHGVCSENITVHVQDQNGKPLEDAVVELVKPDEAKADVGKISDVAVMDQVDKQFAPRVLLIKKGQSVIFPNSDDIRHHVYSFSPAKPFELKLYAGKPKDPIEFNHHGVAVLGCNIHDSMVGYIYIADSDDAMMTNKEGDAQLSVPSVKDASLSVWHKQNSEGAEKRLIVSLADLSKQQDGKYVVGMKTQMPASRDTFEATFKH